MTRTRLHGNGIRVEAILAVVVVWTTASATTLNVANNGTDGAACGPSASPCRSISQAISNASDGDRIVVGPGVYGDLDGDGVFGEPGEEASNSSMIQVGGFSALTIVSRDGAAATIIDARGAGTGVFIVFAAVVFGGANKGFTITGASSAGVQMLFATATVRGNIAADNPGDGFVFDAAVELRDNRALRNGQSGFVSTSSSINAKHLLKNVAAGNGLHGISISGAAPVIVEKNVLADNDGNGIAVASGTNHVIQGNAILGNKFAGIFLSGAGVAASITKNSIFGNDKFVPAGNCGIFNASGLAIDVPDDFWGAGSGPGADPADAIGGVCDSGAGSSTTASTFSNSELKARQKPVR